MYEDDHLEMDYEDRYTADDADFVNDYEQENDGHYDDDPSPYDGTYSEE